MASWKITSFSRRHILKWFVFHCHASFWGCISWIYFPHAGCFLVTTEYYITFGFRNPYKHPSVAGRMDGGIDPRYIFGSKNLDEFGKKSSQFFGAPPSVSLTSTTQDFRGRSGKNRIFQLSFCGSISGLHQHYPFKTKNDKKLKVETFLGVQPLAHWKTFFGRFRKKVCCEQLLFCNICGSRGGLEVLKIREIRG